MAAEPETAPETAAEELDNVDQAAQAEWDAGDETADSESEATRWDHQDALEALGIVRSTEVSRSGRVRTIVTRA